MNNRRISLINPKNLRPSQLFDSFVDEFFDTPMLRDDLSELNTVFTDSIDTNMYETETEIVIEAKVPGFKASDLNIKVEDNMLIIEGKLKEESSEDNLRKYHLKEIRHRSIYRSLLLPARVDAQKATAEFEDGMVNISLPKIENIKSHTIEVKPKNKKAE